MNNHFTANRNLWNARTEHHVVSKFYAVEAFVKGGNTLNKIETDLLGDVGGKRIVHLQCHFGQDTLSLARSGATVTGLDISETAIEEAKKLTARCRLKAHWIVGNVIDPVPALDGQFDIVFTSYGTIGWLPDLAPWAANIVRYLKPVGRFVFAEFHPAVWMWDNDFTHLAYSYFNRQVIEETEEGTYADSKAAINLPSYSWNHNIAEVLTALLEAGLRIEVFQEFDGSPYDCFSNTVKGPDGLFRIKGMEGKLPMVYALRAVKAD